MLIVTRSSQQGFSIGEEVKVKVLSVQGNKVRLGVQAPKKFKVKGDRIYRFRNKQFCSYESL